MSTPPIVTQYAGPTPYKMTNIVTGNDVFTSAFYPNQISNLAIWLDGGDILNNGSNNPVEGTKIDVWVNKAPNSITVTQNFNPSYQPESLDNSVLFTNLNDETTINGLDTTYISAYNNETVFILLTNTETANNYNLLFPTSPGFGSRQLYLSNSSPSKILTSATYLENTLLSAGSILSGPPTLVSTWANGSILKHYVNGQFINQGTVVYNPFAQVNTLIGTDGYAGLNGFNGTISEIIIYSNALSDSDRQKVESYLYWKWNTFTLDPSNPYTTEPYTNYLYPKINSNLIPPVPRNLYSGLPALDSNNYPLIKNFMQTPFRLRNRLF